MIKKGKLDKLLANTGDMCLKRRAKEIVLALNPAPNETVLDAGCGDGFYLHLLSELSKANLVGLDDNPLALELAKGYAPSRKVKLVLGDVSKIPFAANSFDKIICSEVLEHLPDDVAGLREFRRVLKPDGVIAITVPNANYPFLWDPINWILEDLSGSHVKSGFWAGVWNQHVRLYNPQQLIKVVKRAGLKVGDVKVLTHFGLPLNHYLLNLGYRLRMSKFLSADATSSLNKFSVSNQKGLYQRLLSLVNALDRLNDKEFEPDTSTVGIFVKASKV